MGPAPAGEGGSPDSRIAQLWRATQTPSHVRKPPNTHYVPPVGAGGTSSHPTPPLRQQLKMSPLDGTGTDSLRPWLFHQESDYLERWQIWDPQLDRHRDQSAHQSLWSQVPALPPTDSVTFGHSLSLSELCFLTGQVSVVRTTHRGLGRVREMRYAQVPSVPPSGRFLSLHIPRHLQVSFGIFKVPVTGQMKRQLCR